MTVAQSDWPADLLVVGDASLLSSTAAALGLPLRLETYDSASGRHRSSRGRASSAARAARPAR